MIPRRIWINLGAFFLLFVLLVNWAVRNVISLDAIDRPYRITASFESSPGLQANVAVTYLGVQIGTIQRVALRDGTVEVDLDIERGREIPVGVTAAVRRKSAVGEPYVSLEMPPGYQGGGEPIDPGEGYHIPIESTSVPLSYAELFESVDDLVSAIPATELETVVHELAVGLEGRGHDIRTIIEATDEVTGTLAQRTAVFDQLAGDLTRLTATIAGQRENIGQGFDNLAALTATLAASRADIETLLATAPRFGEQVAALLNGIYPNLACTFASTGAVLASAGTEENIANIVAVLTAAPGALDSLESAVVQPGEGGADGYYLGGSFTMGVGPQPPTYPTPATLPESPPLPTCAAGAGPDPGVAGDGSVAAGEGDEVAGPGAGPEVRDRPAPAQPDFAETTGAEGGDETFPLGPVLLAFAAALAAVLLGTLRPWRLLGAGGRDDGGHTDPTDEELLDP